MSSGRIAANRTGSPLIGKVKINERRGDVCRMENAASSAHDGAERQEIKLHANANAPS